MTNLKPKLVDYKLLEFPKKKITNIQKKIVTQDNTKFYLNLGIICVLLIGLYILYYRMQNKYQEDIKLKNNILFLNEYVNNYSIDEYSPLNTEI
tara:strand:- start:302 stop:583 length:282 start_codon:yes stop_codon:yes gene_type:complete